MEEFFQMRGINNSSALTITFLRSFSIFSSQVGWTLDWTSLILLRGCSAVLYWIKAKLGFATLLKHYFPKIRNLNLLNGQFWEFLAYGKYIYD